MSHKIGSEWELMVGLPCSENSEKSDADEEDGDAAMQDATAAAVAMASTIKAPSAPDDLSAYNLDKYDEEESKGAAMGAFSNIKGLSYYGDAKDDPYVTLDSVSTSKEHVWSERLTNLEFTETRG